MGDKLKIVDVIVLGAGAAGLFCAAQAGKRGRNVVVLDHAKRLGGKILMSGGGAVTSLTCTPAMKIFYQITHISVNQH